MVRLVLILISVTLLTSTSANFSAVYSQELTTSQNEADKSEQADIEEDLAIDDHEATIDTEEDVEYELAYPGMLPDNPLYFLKTLRDRIVRLLISDPLKEAEFNILTSNKRMHASLLLVNKEKYELSIDTFSKSNDYLNDAMESLKKAQQKDADINPLLNRLKTSVKKHNQVFSRELAPKFPDSMKNGLDVEKSRLDDIEKAVRDFN